MAVQVKSVTYTKPKLYELVCCVRISSNPAGSVFRLGRL